MSRTSTTATASKLKARPVPPARFDGSAFPLDPAPVSARIPPSGLAPTLAPPSSHNPSAHFVPLVPTPRQEHSSASSGPNYNISLASQLPQVAPSYITSPASNGASTPFANAWPTALPTQAPTPTTSRPLPPGFSSGVLQPDVKPSWQPTTSKTADWGDFDPLK